MTTPEVPAHQDQYQQEVIKGPFRAIAIGSLVGLGLLIAGTLTVDHLDGDPADSQQPDQGISGVIDPGQ